MYAVAALAVATWVACGATQPARLEYVGVEPDPPRLGETTTVKFRAIDERGNPLEGATIRFSLQNADGSTPDAGTVDPATDAGEDPVGISLFPTVASTIEGTGEVFTTLVVRRRVSAVVVVASSEDGSVISRSPPISVAGGAPSASWFTFQCGPIAGANSGGIHAIQAWDDSRHLVAGVKLKCFAHVADRNGDGLPGINVSFLAEAGAITSTATTTDEVVGSAEVLYKTSYPLPEPTDPDSFTWTINNDATHIPEFKVPLWMRPYEWKANPIANFAVPSADCVTTACVEPRRNDPVQKRCPGPNGTDQSPCVLNPRDNLVALIAFTRGEEAFVDANNNGKYDAGETYEDLTEPFVDKNDNATWDPNEQFIDVDGDKIWDGKNGTYDTSTLIWRTEKILWTGIPYDGPDNAADDVSGAEAVFRIVDLRLPPSGTATTSPVALGHHGSVYGRFAFSDPWFNSMAQNSESDGCSGTGSEVVTTEPDRFGEGINISYPPVRVIGFSIRDAHDPNDPTQVAFTTAVPWDLNATCTFTASPEGGNKVGLSFDLASGTVL